MARGADDAPAWHWFGDDGAAAKDAQPGVAEGGSADTVSVGSEPADSASVSPEQRAEIPASRDPYYGPPPLAHLSMGQPLMGQPPVDRSWDAARPQSPASDESVGSASDQTVVLPRPPGTASAPRSYTPLYQPEARVYSLETVVLPKVRDVPDEPPTLSELAARYGLKPAGARPGVGEYVRQLWRYREFISTYANGRIIAQFGQARLGRLWQVLTPLVNAGVYFLIFGIILGTSRGVENFICYLCVGLFIFNYTQLTASSSVTSISGQIGLVRALQFPRASLPIAMSLMQLQNLLMSMIVLVGIVLVSGEPLSLEWVWLVPTLALQSLFNLGLGLFLARLGAKIVDLRQLLPYLLRTWMYASGVLYSVEMFSLHLPSWAVPIMHANPALVFIELARHALMEGIPMSSSFETLWLIAGAWSAGTLLLGFLYFWRGEAEYGRG